MTSIRSYWANESGATAIEYALICGIMGLAVISVAAAGGALDGLYEKLMQVVGALGGAAEED
jgi:Flp pilus assembly pilin Flp